MTERQHIYPAYIFWTRIEPRARSNYTGKKNHLSLLNVRKRENPYTNMYSPYNSEATSNLFVTDTK